MKNTKTYFLLQKMTAVVGTDSGAPSLLKREVDLLPLRIEIERLIQDSDNQADLIMQKCVDLMNAAWTEEDDLNYIFAVINLARQYFYKCEYAIASKLLVQAAKKSGVEIWTLNPDSETWRVLDRVERGFLLSARRAKVTAPGEEDSNFGLDADRSAKLNKLRESIQSRFQPSGDIDTVLSLHARLGTGIKRFLGDVVKECMRTLGRSEPYPFIVVLSGPLAINQAGPYTQANIHFLTHNFKKAGGDYFNTLRTLVELYIIRLGESPLAIPGLSEQLVFNERLSTAGLEMCSSEIQFAEVSHIHGDAGLFRRFRGQLKASLRTEGTAPFAQARIDDMEQLGSCLHPQSLSPRTLMTMVSSILNLLTSHVRCKLSVVSNPITQIDCLPILGPVAKTQLTEMAKFALQLQMGLQFHQRSRIGSTQALDLSKPEWQEMLSITPGQDIADTALFTFISTAMSFLLFLNRQHSDSPAVFQANLAPSLLTNGLAYLVLAQPEAAIIEFDRVVSASGTPLEKAIALAQKAQVLASSDLKTSARFRVTANKLNKEHTLLRALYP